MNKNQIKNRARIADFGEVYTNDKEINAMLNLVKSSVSKLDSKFLEPSCGNGNFLVKIFERKMTYATKANYIENMITVLKNIFAIDILQDNVDESIYRLTDSALSHYKNEFGTDLSSEDYRSIREILTQNIVCDDSLIRLDEYKHSNVEFDVIIGNPPYQTSDNGHGASAKPIYHLFIQKSIALNPGYLTMIVPSRWMVTGKGLDSFRAEMLKDKRIKSIDDFPNNRDCFPDVDIKGGVCYFLWENGYNGDCRFTTHSNGDSESATRPLLEPGMDIVIRDNRAVDILKKVKRHNEVSFSSIVSSRKPFGLATNYSDFEIETTESSTVKLYAKKRIGYVCETKIPINAEYINKFKIFIPEAIGSGEVATYRLKPITGTPGTACTETYIMIGPFENKTTSENALSYIATNFFHYLLGIRKITQHTSKIAYNEIPLQDFNKSWSDEELYNKYGFAVEEIAYIEKTFSGKGQDKYEQ